MKTKHARTNLKLTVLLGGAVVSATVWGAIIGGCVEQPSSITTMAGPTGGTTSGGDDGGDASFSATKAEALFKDIEPDLVETCGVCHEPGGLADTPFLAPADR